MFEEKVYRSSGALVKMARMAGPKSGGLREFHQTANGCVCQSTAGTEKEEAVSAWVEMTEKKLRMTGLRRRGPCGAGRLRG
jgi:hypothetical protein